MKQPFMNRFPVFEYDYREKDVDVTIYSAYEKMPRDDRDDDDDEDEEEYEEKDEESLSRNTRDTRAEKNSLRGISLENLTLQALIDNLPAGITPADVKVSMSMDYNDFAVEGCSLTFYIRKHFPARPELFKKDKASYDKEYAEYEIKKKAYDQWIKDQKVKELEEKLVALKK